MLFKQPKGGLPDDQVAPTDRLLGLVPIYGTKDAGRGLWRKILRVMTKHGLKENMVFAALYSYSQDGVVHSD